MGNVLAAAYEEQRLLCQRHPLGVKFEIEEVKVSLKIPRPREVFFALRGGHVLFNRTDHIILRLTSQANSL
ncbi:hypothetical protein BU24DRAFT_464412 [Aaosphaeria arxii CBS 175.79]|uniref:Uncharacterized protein n=1 Tax=Aaosphaeria arxii CBS 175.79 TaxID=1450172 RepID=A0A6A5XL34_9PLEO|nr:uncharacterized protein BU24DRAFT_464412 [Aaosphaeria arxii CBS 175.79]KAF2013653.1 hypothetical protein BU24DRAFT_464412 [Aaosphaeria arxii CBS 175.79]